MPFPLARRAACLAIALLPALGLSALAEARMVRIPTQYIAALGDKGATSGEDAQTWGLWPIDPGPRGVWTEDYPALMSRGGRAPAGWRFDPSSWWLEEHGLIMEAPVFPLPAGQYVVTGGREVTSILTVSAPDAAGRQGWRLEGGATVHDVTHLRCRAAVYTARDGQSCTPDKTPTGVFPMSPDRDMPGIEGCDKADYQVLIVVGMIVQD